MLPINPNKNLASRNARTNRINKKFNKIMHYNTMDKVIANRLED